jgi:hypothetical protein
MISMTLSFSNKRRAFFRRTSSIKKTYLDQTNSSTNREKKREIQNAIEDSDEELIFEVNLNRTLYIKVSYNRNVVIILLIRKRQKVDLYLIESKNIASTKVIFQLLFENRKKNYLI